MTEKKKLIGGFNIKKESKQSFTIALILESFIKAQQ